MVGRGNVLKAFDVLRPPPVPRIKGAGEHKRTCREFPRGLQEERIHFPLPIRGISSHITQIAGELRRHGNPGMNFRIDAAVKRQRKPRSPSPGELIKSTSAGEREIEIELSDLLAAKIFDLAPLQSSDCD